MICGRNLVGNIEDQESLFIFLSHFLSLSHSLPLSLSHTPTLSSSLFLSECGYICGGRSSLGNCIKRATKNERHCRLRPRSFSRGLVRSDQMMERVALRLFLSLDAADSETEDDAVYLFLMWVSKNRSTSP